MESSSQVYQRGLLFPSPEDLPNPGIEPRSPALQADSLLSEPYRAFLEVGWFTRMAGNNILVQGTARRNRLQWGRTNGFKCSCHIQFRSVQSLSCVQLFVTPWTAARQASLSITNSQNLLKLMSIELVMPSSHQCHVNFYFILYITSLYSYFP